jgi:hypothetical protein
MLKIPILTAVLVVGMPYAQARTSCFQLLTFNPQSGTFSERELGAASVWLEEHMLMAPPPEGVEPNRYVLQQWDRWRMVNQSQRDAALGVEMQKLSRAAGSGVLEFSGDAHLTRLSAANRDRLIGKLREMFPIMHAVDSNVAAQAKEMAAGLKINWLRQMKLNSQGINPPIASPAELRRLSILSNEDDFYSSLVDGSSGVSFDLMATSGNHPADVLGTHIFHDHVRVSDPFARENGYVLPRLRSGLDLIRFMANWDPAALEDLIRYQRYSFPPDVRTAKDLIDYVKTPSEFDALFPPGFLYSSATPLRLHLKSFLMTEEDAAAFLRAAFEHFLLDRSITPEDFRALAAEWSKPGGAQRILAGKFLPYLGWPGMTLRVPISVPPGEYTIIRKDMTGAVPTAMPHQLRDSRRLDHNTMP